MVVSHDREFLTRTVTRVVELDLAQQQVNLYGGGYASYLEEREIARRHAREDYEEYADTRAGLEARARTQRDWMEKGVRNARRKATDNDKIGRKFRAESTEKQAAKARQTERLIERLEVVEEPRKEWELRMEIAAAPRAGAVVATLRAARSYAAATSRSARSTSRSTGPTGSRSPGPNGSGKSTLLAALLGSGAAGRRGRRRSGPGVVVGEVDQARGAVPGRRAAARRVPVGASVPRLLPARRADPAGEVRAARRRTCCGRPRRSRRASAPGPRWRCCRPAG